MKHSTKTLLCVLLAVAAAVCILAACFTLTKKQNSSSGSSAASTAPTQSAYGTVDSFDYQNFTYSDGLDANGYRTGITAQDYVTLPDNVAALPIKKADVTPSDSDVQARIDSLLSQYSTTQAVTDRAAQNGDTVNIDYAGAVDGVAFTGGTYQGYDLTLGSGSFITGFEDQIVGHNTGDTFDVTVTFPDGYDASTDSDGNTVELSGKEAVFRVTVNSISEPVTPELTDEWVDSTFGTGDDVHTVEELKAFFSRALYDQNLEDAIMDALLDTADFKDVPKQISDYYICMFLNYYSQLATYYSTDLNTLAQAQGYASADAMLGASDSVITHLSKQDLLYQAIAETQGIQPTQEQLDAAAASYSGSSYGDNFVHQTALQTAVMEWLKAHVVVS
ncbi:MAG: trigger factor [Faecalibacterium sp.]|nr:trigger factor [Faecalibacterium sp.]